MTEHTTPHPAIEKAALAAADRLAAEHGPRLRTDVLAALHAPDHSPGHYLDPIALASLIVSAATLAWTIYQDLRTTNPKPEADTIARRTRLELPADNLNPQQRGSIIEIVVKEITDND
ncbi:hypothetical protein [Actinokineospora diospyrosa]|uniref:Uncharacterized protein n=1 Tax=Actinokineospora diospyrosa TaxID=103728 RepID=A0ABT1I9T0_9PSEU|nr:hypothetical protein [Actinokineospora diospyrosa]MCP2269286.1 hypothetical protein [Actinokineospora diospyrosa]